LDLSLSLSAGQNGCTKSDRAKGGVGTPELNKQGAIHAVRNGSTVNRLLGTAALVAMTPVDSERGCGCERVLAPPSEVQSPIQNPTHAETVQHRL
jgi:hypothetical protein